MRIAAAALLLRCAALGGLIGVAFGPLAPSAWASGGEKKDAEKADAKEEKKEEKKDKKDEGGPSNGGKILGLKYINLDLIAVPFLTGNQPDGQMNLVVALELVDTEQRDKVMERLPRVRAAIYDVLIAQVSNRVTNHTVPPNEKLKRYVRRATESIIGKDILADVLIQQAYYNRPLGR